MLGLECNIFLISLFDGFLHCEARYRALNSLCDLMLKPVWGDGKNNGMKLVMLNGPLPLMIQPLLML